jgi:hypothetical protein
MSMNVVPGDTALRPKPPTKVLPCCMGLVKAAAVENVAKKTTVEAVLSFMLLLLLLLFCC